MLILVVGLFFVSCGEKSKSEIELDAIKKEARAHMNDLPVVDLSMSNPELFLGSGMGAAFMSFIKTQNFDLALQFTSKESIENHGKEKILEKYKSLKTNYTLTRTSKVVDGDYTTLRYTTNEFATSKYKDFVVVVENDSCKIVLPENLDDFLK